MSGEAYNSSGCSLPAAQGGVRGILERRLRQKPLHTLIEMRSLVLEMLREGAPIDVGPGEGRGEGAGQALLAGGASQEEGADVASAMRSASMEELLALSEQGDDDATLAAARRLVRGGDAGKEEAAGGALCRKP